MDSRMGLRGRLGGRCSWGPCQPRRRESPTSGAAPGREARFTIGDASDPGFDTGSYDAVLCRHVLWALPNPVAAMARWVGLLNDDGVVVLVEGRWHTGGGLTAVEAERIVRTARAHVEVQSLPDPIYWGKEIDDERYLLVSNR